MMKSTWRKLFILLLAGSILLPVTAEGNKYVQLLQKTDYGNAVTYVIDHDPEAENRSPADKSTGKQKYKVKPVNRTDSET